MFDIIKAASALMLNLSVYFKAWYTKAKRGCVTDSQAAPYRVKYAIQRSQAEIGYLG